MRRFAAILAGGRGEPLWPHSRTCLPKQFLSLWDGPTFLQRTYDRIAGMTDAPEVFVLTAEGTLDLVRAQIPGLDPQRLVGEPLARGTAATAVLAALTAAALAGPEAVVALVPADHAFFGDAGFQDALAAAYATAEREGEVVLIGVPPTRPEPGYGYIRLGADLAPCGAARIASVDGFVEQPPLARAIECLRSGRYLWNTGICACRTDVLLGRLGLHEPGLAQLITGLAGSDPVRADRDELRRLLQPLRAISLDHALLVPVGRAAVVIATLAWDDVGSWDALSRLQPQDEHGNVQHGRAVLSATERTVVYNSASQRLVVTHGVEDLVVVDTPDTTLIAARDLLPGLQAALGAVRASGFQAYLDEAVGLIEPGPQDPATLPAPDQVRTVAKPWGREVWWAHCEAYAAKRLEVRGGQALSLQYHQRKHETLYVLVGRVRLRLGGEERVVGPGHVAVISPGTIHRLEALTDAVIFEVSTPDLDDVVRLEDRYGRAAAPPLLTPR